MAHLFKKIEYLAILFRKILWRLLQSFPSPFLLVIALTYKASLGQKLW